jgi:peptidoglycan-associated lipoprotein
MTRSHRVVALTLIATAIAGAACRKKPETAPAPTQTAAAPTETCDAACRQRRADSIRVADSLRIARENANRSAAERAERARAARESLIARIYFDYDQSDITGASRSTLDAKLPILRANPAIRLRISGHADERGSDEYNLALGQRRAAAAKRYLTDQGIDPSRIETVSYGEERPAVQGMEESAYARNRRDEFEIVSGGENIIGAAQATTNRNQVTGR